MRGRGPSRRREGAPTVPSARPAPARRSGPGSLCRRKSWRLWQPLDIVDEVAEALELKYGPDVRDLVAQLIGAATLVGYFMAKVVGMPRKKFCGPSARAVAVVAVDRVRSPTRSPTTPRIHGGDYSLLFEQDPVCSLVPTLTRWRRKPRVHGGLTAGGDRRRRAGGTGQDVLEGEEQNVDPNRVGPCSGRSLLVAEAVPGAWPTVLLLQLLDELSFDALGLG